MPHRELILIVHNVRSCYNVGSLLRTCDGLGIDKVYLTGYTPYPQLKNDPRLPHLARKIDAQIHKTALGAENSLNWTREPDVIKVINALHKDKFTTAALEQTSASQDLDTFAPPKKLALLVGSEVEGVGHSLLDQIDIHLEIPMKGKKESFNVTVAAAIALYHLSVEKA